MTIAPTGLNVSSLNPQSDKSQSPVTYKITIPYYALSQCTLHSILFRYWYTIHAKCKIIEINYMSNKELNTDK